MHKLTIDGPPYIQPPEVHQTMLPQLYAALAAAAPGVRKLYLRWHGVLPLDPWLSRLRHLSKCILLGASLDLGVHQALARTTTLTDLVLVGARAVWPEWERGPCPLPTSLTALDLTDCTTYAVEGLNGRLPATLELLPRLASLGVNSGELEVGRGGLKPLTHLTTLQELNLSFSAVRVC